MKSIFLGSPRIYSVYTKEQIARLESAAGLENIILTKKTLPDHAQSAAEAEYLFSTWGMERFTREEIRQWLPKLKAVFYAAGTVKSFARAFLEENITVFSAWGANAVPVAEYTAAQIVLANKGFFRCCRTTHSPQTRREAADYFKSMPGNYGCSVGIIGAGQIGRLVIGMLRQHRLNVIVYDPYLSDASAAALGVEKSSLEELFARCQTISNHTPNLPSTVGMLNYELFSRMKKTATFINTGRGAQVVEEDLIRALCEEPQRVALLDVTLPEPPREDSPLYSLPNVFLTPHIAGSAGDETHRMAEYMIEEFTAFSAGKQTRYEVTLEMLEVMA